MILFIEIIAIAAALAFLVVAIISLVKNAIALGRTGKRAQERMEPKIMDIGARGERAQMLGLRIAGRAEDLERSGARLSVTMEKITVLMSAATEAKERLDKTTSYIGL